MKGFKFISAKEIIVSYMCVFDTNKITKTEFNNWGSYIEKKLSTEDYDCIAFYGKSYLDELKKEDNGFLFNIGDCEIKLADGKDLNQFALSYISVDMLLKFWDIATGYKKSKDDELTK